MACKSLRRKNWRKKAYSISCICNMIFLWGLLISEMSSLKEVTNAQTVNRWLGGQRTKIKLIDINTKLKVIVQFKLLLMHSQNFVHLTLIWKILKKTPKDFGNRPKKKMSYTTKKYSKIVIFGNFVASLCIRKSKLSNFYKKRKFGALEF